MNMFQPLPQLAPMYQPHPEQIAVVNMLKKADNVLLVARGEDSVDGLSSLLSMQYVLQKLGKSVTSLVTHDVPKRLQFLAGADSVKTDLSDDGDFVISLSTKNASVERVKYSINDSSVDILVSPKDGQFRVEDVTYDLSYKHFDVIVMLGIKSLESLGILYEAHSEIFSSIPVVNISADPKNERYGKLQMVDVSASSTSEIVYHLIFGDTDFAEYADETLSSLLLAGIVSATGSFLERNTTPMSMDVAAYLQEDGADHSFMIDHLYKTKNLATLRAWGRILSNLSLDRIHQIAWSRITYSDLEESEAEAEDIQSLIDELLRHIVDAEIACLFIEKEDEVIIQVRSSDQAHLFRDLTKSDEYHSEMRDHGVDLYITGKPLATVEAEFLRSMLGFQKSRHGIPTDIPLTHVNLLEEAREIDLKAEKKTKKSVKKSMTASAPASVPFDAPKVKPQIKTGEDKKEEKIDK